MRSPAIALLSALLATLLAVLGAWPLPALAGVEAFNMGFLLPGIRDANLTDVRASLQLWAEEVARPYGFQAKAIMYDDMDTLYRDTMAGRVQLVVAPGMEIAEIFKPEEVTEGFSGRKLGGVEGLALVVARQGGIRAFPDLRGKRLLCLSNDRLTEVYLDIQCQQQVGAPCAGLFDLAEEKRDVHAIHKVFFGQADAALVRLSALRAASELNPQVGNRLRVLQEWKTTSLSFGMMPSNTTQAFRDQILRSAMSATSTVRGKQILELFKVDHMERADRTDMQPYWRLYQEHQALKRTRSARKP